MAKTCARERNSGNDGLFGEFAANVPEIVWMREVGSERILYVSPAWEVVTGCPPPAHRDDFLAIVHPDDAARVRRDADGRPLPGARLPRGGAADDGPGGRVLGARVGSRTGL